MSGVAWMQVGLYFAVLVALAIPVGEYMHRVFFGGSARLEHFFAPFERMLYRLAGIDADEDMGWKRYAATILVFNFCGACVLYLVQRLQGWLPFNPAGFGAVPPEVAFNTAISFTTNTNWQAYGGETTLSPLTQMLGLAVQNFLSAATGMAVLVAVTRGFVRQSTAAIGNAWVDITRGVVRLLLPLSLVLASTLSAAGVVQTFDTSVTVDLMDPTAADGGGEIDRQVIALGPVASQVAIKQLGTNGGGFYNVNAAHPLENPTPWTNFLEMLAILLIPAASCFTFGAAVRQRRQGWTLFAAMLIVCLPLTWATIAAEQAGNPTWPATAVDAMASDQQSGGNLEGKEVRFGVTNSALWAVATTAASNGSVNAMHDSFLPLGGLFPMWLMQLGEVVFGGVGSGLYGMLAYALVAVFVAGLLVGRTPEYLGKKIEAFEIKMASLVLLVPAAMVLVGTAVACLVPAGTDALGNPGAHGFSEILYSFSSTANNNGSAFAGLTASGPFYATLHAVAMAIGRYWLIVAMLAAAGSLAAKRAVPPSAGTLPTDTPLFVGLLVGTVILFGALTFIPALALGPVVEHLTLFSR